MTSRSKVVIGIVFLIGVSLCLQAEIRGQGTAFSYQGTLAQGGTPANGNFQMTFTLWTAASGGSQVGPSVGPQTVSVTNGNFAVLLDFGSGPFSGADRFLEITVGATVLSPRPKMQSVPYAIRALTVTGPVSGTTPGATLTVTNAQPGITNPSPTNLPPAAVRGEATSTSDTNIGVLGVGNGTSGIGVLGLTSGNGGSSGTGDAVGVMAISTSPTGETTGVLAQVASPNGTAVEAQVGTAGFLFRGVSDEPSTSNPKFVVTAIGQVRANGSVFARGFQGNSGLFGVTDAGNMTVAHIDTGTLTSTGNVTVGGTLNALNLNIGGGNLSVGNLTAGGDVSVGAVLRTNSVMSTNANPITFNSPVQISSLTSPNGTVNFGASSLLTTGSLTVSGNAGVGGTVQIGSILSGGNATLCTLSTAANVVRFCSSSLRYKKEVKTFSDGLSLVKQFHPIAFKWKENGEDDLGLAAEQVAAVDSRFVFKNANGDIEGVRYGQINAVLINAIREQQEQIDRQQAIIHRQQAQLDRITRLLEGRGRLSGRKAR